MRLTRFNKLTNEYEYHLHNPNTSMIEDEIAGTQKLGQLEDFEEELGIKLLTLFKALKNGVYVKNLNSDKSGFYYRKVECLFFRLKQKAIVTQGCNDYPFKGYGKTWALTKEELL